MAPGHSRKSLSSPLPPCFVPGGPKVIPGSLQEEGGVVDATDATMGECERCLEPRSAGESGVGPGSPGALGAGGTWECRWARECGWAQDPGGPHRLPGLQRSRPAHLGLDF